MAKPRPDSQALLGGLGAATRGGDCFPWLTVRGDVEYALRLRGHREPGERARRAGGYLAAVGLMGFEEAYG